MRIGDVNLSKDLFDLLIIYVPNEVIAKEICQHFVDCFQFIYREAISEFEKEEEDEENDLLVEQQNLDLESLLTFFFDSSRLIRNFLKILWGSFRRGRSPHGNPLRKKFFFRFVKVRNFTPSLEDKEF